MNKKILKGAAYRNVSYVAKHILILCCCVITIAPFYWMIRTSLVPTEDVFGAFKIIPDRITFDHYANVWNNSSFPRNVKNSIVVSIITTGSSVMVSTLAAYGFSRFNFYLKDFFNNALLLVYMLPGVAVAIPLFLIIRSYGLLNTYASLILAYTTFVLPFSIWMLRAYFDSVPYEMEEAAMIDGANRWQSLVKVVLPVALPGIAAVAAFAFLEAWKEYLFAVTFIQSSSKHMLSVGLQAFQQQYSVRFDLLMAASTIASIPVILVFGFVQRFLVEGLTVGASKG